MAKLCSKIKSVAVSNSEQTVGKHQFLQCTPCNMFDQTYSKIRQSYLEVIIVNWIYNVKVTKCFIFS